MRPQSDLEDRRKAINRRISLISATLFLLAGTIGAFVLGERISDQTRYGLIIVTALWFGYRILRLRRDRNIGVAQDGPDGEDAAHSDQRSGSGV